MDEQPLDKIHIRDLKAQCIVGIFPEEREEKQDVVINITLYAVLRRASKSDRIEDTVDYKTMKKRILAMVCESSYQLIESLAERISVICLSEPLVQRVKVSVDKPGALRYARSVAVEIVRERTDGA